MSERDRGRVGAGTRLGGGGGVVIVYISRHFLHLPGKAVIYLAGFYSLISPLCWRITPLFVGKEVA